MLWYSAQDLFARLGLDPNRSYVALAELCATLGVDAATATAQLGGLLRTRARVLPWEDEETGEERDQ